MNTVLIILTKNLFIYFDSELIFDIEGGASQERGSFESLSPKAMVMTGVINCWANVLNYEDGLLETNKLCRYFFNTNVLVKILKLYSQNKILFTIILDCLVLNLNFIYFYLQQRMK